MPDVPADHVGDGERALHHRADLVALVDVLPPPRLGAAAARSPRTAASISAICSSVYGVELDGVVLLLLPGLLALGADHQPVLARQHRAVVVAEHLAPSTRARPARRTRSACRAPPPARCAGTRGDRVAAAPTTRARSPSRTRARRAAGRPSSGRAARRRDRGDLVLADQRVAADQRRRRDRPAPHASSAP